MTKIKSIAVAIAILSTTSVFAQIQTDKIKVSGNCGMCAKKIETAAKEAGASEAKWDKNKKQLTVKYEPATTSNDAIQKKVADAGYDTEKYTADMEVYNNLHECCKYDNKRKK